MNCSTPASAGSSPRARGTPEWRVHHDAVGRFIPAGAGNAASRSACARCSAVHPRGRGERSHSFSGARTSSGSSPRARGTHRPSGRVEAFRRFIPAGAGNALLSAKLMLPPAVHPRGRGERPGSTNSTSSTHGSSPRARGTLIAFNVELASLRFIPAGAGNAPRDQPTRCRWTVHPRGRGERTTRPTHSLPVDGSSPRARGTH